MTTSDTIKLGLIVFAGVAGYMVITRFFKAGDIVVDGVSKTAQAIRSSLEYTAAESAKIAKKAVNYAEKTATEAGIGFEYIATKGLNPASTENIIYSNLSDKTQGQLIEAVGAVVEAPSNLLKWGKSLFATESDAKKAAFKLGQ